MTTLPHDAHEGNSSIATIPLTQGKVAIVDAEDTDLATYKWHFNTCYAVRWAGKQKLLMHRIILERKLNRPIQDGLFADHINRDQLDNRRSNLREVTLTQNARNSERQKNNTSQYIGVSYQDSYYIARIGSNGVLLGSFKTALDASFCYDRTALEQWGEYARLNHPIEEVLAWQPPPPFLHSNNTSGYHGVNKLKYGDKWQANYWNGYKRIHLGTFNAAEDAARAYDRAVIQYKGKHAPHTNFPLEDYKDG